ncbi:hypothetical protein EYD10_00683 [Varanus komodoensis]|nr:hypothetical protein EYD10_00683 [Varanus komodoensis]
MLLGLLLVMLDIFQMKAVLLAGWALFLFLAYKVSKTDREYQEYNPYEVLNLDPGATVSEIKKQYRLLSLKFHPDKGGDEVMFMRIAKAYAALTDEESRKNWEEFGNPDGPQATSFGIALPAWIVDQKNSILTTVQNTCDHTGLPYLIMERPRDYNLQSPTTKTLKNNILHIQMELKHEQLFLLNIWCNNRANAQSSTSHLTPNWDAKPERYKVIW